MPFRCLETFTQLKASAREACINGVLHHMNYLISREFGMNTNRSVSLCAGELAKARIAASYNGRARNARMAAQGKEWQCRTKAKEMREAKKELKRSAKANEQETDVETERAEAKDEEVEQNAKAKAEEKKKEEEKNAEESKSVPASAPKPKVSILSVVVCFRT